MALFLGEIFLEGVAGYRFLSIGLETNKLGTYWRMPEPWLPYFSKGLLYTFINYLHGIHCYSENGQTHTVHICYCWPCDLSSIQTWENLRKAVIIAPYPDQLVVICLIFYIPANWGNIPSLKLFNWVITPQNKKKRCSPDRKVHLLLVDVVLFGKMDSYGFPFFISICWTTLHENA